MANPHAHDLRRRGHLLTRRHPAVGCSIADAFVLKDGGVYLVTRPDGDIPEGGPHGYGLYYHDCRFLSTYTLTLDGRGPIVLVSTGSSGYAGIFELTNPELPSEGGGTLDRHELAVRWDRVVEGGGPAVHESLRVHNYGAAPVDVILALTFGADFADVFTVRGLADAPRGQRHPARWAGGVLHLRYDGLDELRRATEIRFFRAPDHAEGGCARFDLHLGPGAEEEIPLSIALQEGPVEERRPPAPPDLPSLAAARRAAAEAHSAALTRVDSDAVALQKSLDRSLADLGMLRSSLGEETFYAAGVPWFVALFGRDALIVALEALAYDPAIARDTLRLLARHQGTRDEPTRDEEPGKILHEYRVGELAHVHAIPQTPYYGSVDATPLFLVLLGQHAAWTGSLDLFHELRPHVDAALGWIEAHGESLMPGYVAYLSRATGGTANLGWKDSGDAVVMADGSLARQPIALVEVQGYVYLARTSIAELLERAGEPAPAARLRASAESLKARFLRDFWLPEQGFLALALTAGGPAEVLTSNAGQTLFTGLLTPALARATAESLLSEPMWSGWGIRTLSSEARAYNPVAYHRGTVWPHDNALILAGLRRCGFDAAALQVFSGLLDASAHFPLRRLPEVFSGFPRRDYGVPVRYPVACHPQAWAAGSLPYMLTCLLGLSPDGFTNRLRVVRPVLPAEAGRVALRGLRVGSGVVDLSFERGQHGEIHVRVMRNDGGVVVEVI
jgi:glycogen debranching enzyme